MMNRFNSWLNILGGALIFLVGLIHLILAPAEFQEVPYLGAGFGLAFILAVIAAVGILRNGATWAWGLGVLVAFGSMAGYLVSRTIGLPISGIEAWGPPVGYISLVLEALLIGQFAWVHPWNVSNSQQGAA